VATINRIIHTSLENAESSLRITLPLGKQCFIFFRPDCQWRTTVTSLYVINVSLKLHYKDSTKAEKNREEFVLSKQY